MDTGWIVIIILILIAILAVIGVAFALPRVSANIKARAEAEAVRINARANLITALKSHGPHQVTMDAKLNISVTPREYEPDTTAAQVEPAKATGVEVHAVRLIQASLNAYGAQSCKIMSSDDVSGNGMSPNTWGRARQWLIDNGHAMRVTVDGKESTQARYPLSSILAKLPSVDDSILRSAISALPRVAERGNDIGDRGIGQDSAIIGG